MRHEPTIPLFLWVATAALAHILWGGGADQVVRVVENNRALARFATAVRHDVALANRPIEVTLLDESAPEPERPDETKGAVIPQAPPPEQQPPETTQPDLKEEKQPEKRPELKPDEQKKPEKVEPKKDKPKPSEKPEPEVHPKPEAEKKKEEKKKEPEKEAQPVQVVELDRKIAVKQHTKDPNEADNPNAEFLAEQAHHTDKRVQARVTSTDQNDPEPNPGVAHNGPSDDPGSADVTDIAQSDSSPGNPNRAFAKSAQDGKDKSNEGVGKQEKPAEDVANKVFGETGARGRGVESGNEQSEVASKAHQAHEARAAADPFEKTLNDPAGENALPAESDRVLAQRAQAQSRARPTPKGNGGRLPNLRGMASLGLTPGGLNPNLTSITALEAIGSDRLNQERVADGERRRSKHRGSWHPIGIDRWRSAIENYVASVQPGNQTELNTARSAFANYLNDIHQRLHDEFAFKFLGSLDALPGDSPLNREDLTTHIEIVLSKDDGHIVRMGVTRASGSTMFDVGALESVQRASPYGAPPREIVSPDGNVYLHWEFWRNPNYACSTYFAHPYILRFKPTQAPPPNPHSTPPPEDGEKHGERETEKADGTQGG
jgi:hypothetical protein